MKKIYKNAGACGPEYSSLRVRPCESSYDGQGRSYTGPGVEFHIGLEHDTIIAKTVVLNIEQMRDLRDFLEPFVGKVASGTSMIIVED